MKISVSESSIELNNNGQCSIVISDKIYLNGEVVSGVIATPNVTAGAPPSPNSVDSWIDSKDEDWIKRL